MGEKGLLSNQDVKTALGTASMSFLDRVKNGLFKEAVGGLGPDQKRALNGLLDKADKEDRLRTIRMLEKADEILNDPETDKDTARGLRAYLKLTPKEHRDEYESIKKKRKGGAAAEEPQGFNMEADANAEYGRTVE